MSVMVLQGSAAVKTRGGPFWIWEAFYIENERFDLYTLRVPNWPLHPHFKIQ
jgi:hypothetical protein